MSRELRTMFEQSVPTRAERRRGLDARGRIGVALACLSWLLWGSGLYLTYFSYPQITTYFDTLYDKVPDLSYKPEYIYAAEILWAFGALLCPLSIIQFRKRNRRRRDKPHYGIFSAFILNVLTAAGFAIYMLVQGFI